MGYKRNGKWIAIDMIPTIDPEIELEDIEKLKTKGQAAEDDFFRDLTLSEQLTSNTDEIDYYTWMGTLVANS